MENLDIYNRAKACPKEALKPIQAGRLKGKSDINPMWRIKLLTEIFGPIGFGWKYKITSQRPEKCDNGETAAFVDIDMFVKMDGEWSEAIQGIGGAMFVANERNGAYVSDECFKMALTDAISVACKALGFAADVYWDKDTTKYSGRSQQDNQQSNNQQQASKPQPKPQPQQKRAYADSMLIDDKIMKWICDNQVKHTNEGRQFDFSAFVGKYIEANALQIKNLHDAYDDWNLRKL